MKRSWCLNLWIGLILFTILCIPISQTLAADPTPAAATTPDPAVQGAMEVPEGIPITAVSITNGGPFDSNSLVAQVAFKLIMTLGFNVPDYKPFGTIDRLKAGISGTTDKYVQTHSPDPGGEYPSSGVFSWCPGNQPNLQSTTPKAGRIITASNNETHDMYISAKLLGSTFAPGYSLTPNTNGNFLEAPQKTIVALSPTPGCNINATGVQVTPTPLPIVSGSGIVASLLQTFSKLFPKQTSQNSTSIIVGQTMNTADQVKSKLFTGENDPNLNYNGEPAKDLASDLKTPGGIYMTFLTAVAPANYGANTNGDIGGQPLLTNSVDGKIIRRDTDFHCAITSKDGPDHPSVSNCPGEIIKPSSLGSTGIAGIGASGTSGTTTDSGDVCAVAAKYHIPCCQLLGVMATEVGGGSESCSAAPEPNTCCTNGACGPANVLCGQYKAWAGNDNINICSQAGSAELLARAMRFKLCQADNQQCETGWAVDKDKALQSKYDIPDNINDPSTYTAAGYFYGMAHGCVPDWCTQYRFGAGKSYCDSVQNFCITSNPENAGNGQILPSFPHPEFCQQCKQTEFPSLQCP